MSKLGESNKNFIRTVAKDNRPGKFRERANRRNESTKLDRTQELETVVKITKHEEMGNLDLIEDEQIPTIPDPNFQAYHKTMPRLKDRTHSFIKQNPIYNDVSKLNGGKELFFDPHFNPATALENYQTLRHDNGQPGNIYWVRPWQLVTDPLFFDNENNTCSKDVNGKWVCTDLRKDICQGELNDCWFLATLGNLSCFQDVMSRVIPEGQNFDPKNGYKGKFYFYFYYYGDWIQIVVDDLIPVIVYPNGMHRFYGCSSESPNEFWSALIEKAYAKFQGGYHMMKYGNSNQAMMDFTGGIAEQREIKNEIEKRDDKDYSIFFRQIKKAINNKSLVNACIVANSMDEMEARGQEPGLYVGHAYSVTKVHTENLIKSDETIKKQMCLSLRNPWGKGTEEYKVPANYFDDEKLQSQWRRFVNQSDLDGEDGGEFWMPIEAFVKHFTHLNMCRLNLYHYRCEGDWTEIERQSKWSKEENTCGGLSKELVNNPFVPVELTGGTKSDQMMVILQQKVTRSEKLAVCKSQDCISYRPIALVIYKITRTPAVNLSIKEIIDQKIGMANLIKKKSVNKVHAEMVATRDYCLSLKKLEASKYVVIPVALENDTKTAREGKFYIKVVTEQEDEV